MLPDDVSKTEHLVNLHRFLLTARTLEELCIERLGHWYASIGEEATVVGTFSALQPGDVASPHYRGGLAAFWLRGLPLVDLVAGLLAKQTSVSRGRLSGLHSGPISRGVLPYVTNVIGPNLSTAAGMALAFKLRREPHVVVASFGDGSAGLGQFHESLNLSALLRLPIVWVCQNNQYSISTRFDASHAGGSIARWASSYGMPAEQVDGNDVAAVHAAVAAQIARARAAEGPGFIEARTYRTTGHFNTDEAPYRRADELAYWHERDPLRLSTLRLRDRGVDEESLAAMSAHVLSQVQVAWDEAAALPDLPAGELRIEEVSTIVAGGTGHE